MPAAPKPGSIAICPRHADGASNATAASSAARPCPPAARSSTGRQSSETAQPRSPVRRRDQAHRPCLAGPPEGSCRTITFDRDTEFAAYALPAQAPGTEPFLCDPRSPSQKGAVENTNDRIRRFLPGDRTLAEIAGGGLQRVAIMLNATPRRCLGYGTPHEVFHGQLAALFEAL